MKLLVSIRFYFVESEIRHHGRKNTALNDSTTTPSSITMRRRRQDILLGWYKPTNLCKKSGVPTTYDSPKDSCSTCGSGTAFLVIAETATGPPCDPFLSNYWDVKSEELCQGRGHFGYTQETVAVTNILVYILEQQLTAMPMNCVQRQKQ